VKRERPAIESLVPAAPDPLRRAPGCVPEHGRGATFNPGNRFRREGREAYDDGWPAAAESASAAASAGSSPSSARSSRASTGCQSSGPIASLTAPP